MICARKNCNDKNINKLKISEVDLIWLFSQCYFFFTASHSVHIILSQEERITDQSFEIVLGGENNQRSWISRGSNQILRAHIDRILSEDSFQPFWISWAEDNIQVGTGSTPSSISQFMYTRQSESETRGIRFIGFATSDGATGEFRLWQKEGMRGTIICMLSRKIYYMESDRFAFYLIWQFYCNCI